MKTKITDKFFHLPPFISAEWGQVMALHMEDTSLVVVLKDNSSAKVPNLPVEILETIFDFHVKHLESEQERKMLGPRPSVHPSREARKEASPFRIGLEGNDPLNGLSAMQHNREMAHAPNLPPEVLQKISAIAKIVAPGELSDIPTAEPHCNCPHCQIARAISSGMQKEIESVPEEETVLEEDLRFEQWHIAQAGDRLYTVSNKLDSDERYNVFLGEPVGCTCGKVGCEHVLAVLKS